MSKKNHIKNHEFLESSTWLKCSHQLKGMFTLTRSLTHERHMIFLLVILIKVNFWTKWQFEHLIKWDTPPKRQSKRQGPNQIGLVELSLWYVINSCVVTWWLLSHMCFSWKHLVFARLYVVTWNATYVLYTMYFS